MTEPDEVEPTTMRGRYRAQVRDEIKQVALRQIAESGPGGLSVAAIGKELGVSGPALYRYFSSRDDLLTELVIDAYTDLAAALRAATRNATSRKPQAGLEAVARSYRAWALAQPHRYQLLFGPPLPRFDAHARRLVDASQEAMNTLVEVLADLPDGGATRINRALASQLATWSRNSGHETDAKTALRAVLIWSRVHGFVSLEIAGNYASLGIDPDQLFGVELTTLVPDPTTA
jgi:AcrR family transcriptional regulator